MVALAPARTCTVEIERLWGLCPVQAFGLVNGKPFYFRAMYDRWSISVASTRTGDPVQVAIGVEDGWCFERTYGYGLDASFMDHVQARILISTTASYYMEGRKDDRRTTTASSKRNSG